MLSPANARQTLSQLLPLITQIPNKSLALMNRPDRVSKKYLPVSLFSERGYCQANLKETGCCLPDTADHSSLIVSIHSWGDHYCLRSLI